MKKLSLLLAIILLFSSFVLTACKEETPEQTTPQDSAPEVTTPTETTPEPTVPVEYPAISMEQLANYEIVLAKSSSEETDKLTKELQQTMQNAFGMPINLKTENAYNETQYEILIGHTSRAESELFLTRYGFLWDDYGYAIVDDKLVIAGKNEDGTFAALRAFIDYVKGHKGGDTFFSNQSIYLVTNTSYPCSNMSVNGIPVSQLSILCNEQSLGGVAQIIRDAIIEACGIDVPIVTDEEVDDLKNVILIGDTAFIDTEAVPDEIAYPTGNEYYISTGHCCFWLRAKTAQGYYSAAADLAMQLSGKGGSETYTISAGKREGTDGLPVMSFNLMAGVKANDKRVDRVIEIILKYRPAVVGVQEATDTWIALLKQRLDGVYTVVGEGRNADGGDEHSAILYLTDEFNCLESGTKWLSDTPDVPGSKFAESHYTRIMTYVHLSRKSDGKEFLHVNTHLDYGTTDAEEAVKVEQIEVLFREIGKFSYLPTVITGDFNATVDSPVYNRIQQNGYHNFCAEVLETSPTYHGLMGTTGEPSHIDFILNNGRIYNDYYLMDMYYRICNERVNNENVSDHYPILTVLYFSPTGK